eukprot:gb/GECG01013020.1/.p1 GENE.gb/GECG01013020.1/~~gb/GECG01013020.1/.p1  ORF type:complete len:2431 (+),score=261.97 gb/GECG01013020.1/:1-7293(+)
MRKSHAMPTMAQLLVMYSALATISKATEPDCTMGDSFAGLPKNANSTHCASAATSRLIVSKEAISARPTENSMQNVYLAIDLPKQRSWSVGPRNVPVTGTPFRLQFFCSMRLSRIDHGIPIRFHCLIIHEHSGLAIQYGTWYSCIEISVAKDRENGPVARRLVSNSGKRAIAFSCNSRVGTGADCGLKRTFPLKMPNPYAILKIMACITLQKSNILGNCVTMLGICLVLLRAYMPLGHKAPLRLVSGKAAPASFHAPSFVQRKQKRPLRAGVVHISAITAFLFSSPIAFVKGTTNLRENIIAGKEARFENAPQSNTLRIACSVLNWEGQNYGAKTYVSLGAHETFNCGGGSQESGNIINLTESESFRRLDNFSDDVHSITNVLVIKSANVQNGTTGESGGFIVRTAQQYLTVKSCSPTGDIWKYGGGICGKNHCKIAIFDSVSRGAILGQSIGSIAGLDIGRNGEAHIATTYSIGNIKGPGLCGIAGEGAGTMNGSVHALHPFSSGIIPSDDVLGVGIVGSAAGSDHGKVNVQKCYSAGQIGAHSSGGNSGYVSALREESPNITDCYKRGDIQGLGAGGISGDDTTYQGFSSSTSPGGWGTEDTAGGIIGGLSEKVGKVEIVDSVYDHIKIVGSELQFILTNVTLTGKSANLYDIRGQLYRRENSQRYNGRVIYLNGVVNFERSFTIKPDVSFFSWRYAPNHIRPHHATLSFLPATFQVTFALLFFVSLPIFSRISRKWNNMIDKTYDMSISLHWKPKALETCSGKLLPLIASIVVLLHLRVASAYVPPPTGIDLRDNIIHGSEPCFHYIPEKSLFEMNCSVLYWRDQGYKPDTHISLSVNETFDGGGHNPNQTRIIDLNGTVGFEGLFTVREEVTTFGDAPLITNVNVKNGELSYGVGCIVQSHQKFFFVDSCSYTGGVIGGEAGGICGRRCGLNGGEVKIFRSYSAECKISTGAGGIAGEQVGYNGVVHIVQCYSTGTIAQAAGGICGGDAGEQYGKVFISQSFSTGDMGVDALNSGGIVGHDAAKDNGYVLIKECYTTGRILAEGSGGITGSSSGVKGGKVSILDCYTQGNIGGQEAGGITGLGTGGSRESSSSGYSVEIKNTYASGIVNNDAAGGIIGSIADDDVANNIYVQYSLYTSDSMVGGYSAIHPNETGNSNDLDKIGGQLYHHGGVQRWDNGTWTVIGSDQLPILRYQLQSPHEDVQSTTPSITSSPSPSVLTPSPASPSATPTPTPTPFPTDLRENIMEGTEPCFDYNSEKKLFRMICDVLEWQEQRYGASTHITLHANEVFDGGGDRHDGNVIDLAGVVNFEGLFRISRDVYSILNAPLIRNVDVKGGVTAVGGGFVVQSFEGYFEIDSCSSTGDITENSGGIAGEYSGRNYGEVEILSSHSEGRILGRNAGGITGEYSGQNGVLRMTRCYSTGSIEGENAGGLCGYQTGDSGIVYVTESHATGDILQRAQGGGGVTGGAPAGSGIIRISKCYSTGKILAKRSGGIIGSEAARYGQVYIRDCYTRGSIQERYAGGIVGGELGGFSDAAGSKLFIENTFASGALVHAEAGGIIGSILYDFDGTAEVLYSVFNGSNTGTIIGDDPNDVLVAIGTSNNLANIRGQLYSTDIVQLWDNETWTVTKDAQVPILRFQLQAANESVKVPPSPDLRGSILEGKEQCFRFTTDQKLFEITCSVLYWKLQGYKSETFLTLAANEVFDGSSPTLSNGSMVDLTGIDNFRGLFSIRRDVKSNAEAPVIQNVHTKNGITAFQGGFIIRAGQRLFNVDDCSSTGDITGGGSGGICGLGCGKEEGEIKVSNSSSTGSIMGNRAGGILGAQAGGWAGIVHVTGCLSSGSIGKDAGGIAGRGTGDSRAVVYIDHCFSTGTIVGSSSGGILGVCDFSGFGVHMYVSKCYSTGDILEGADGAGGIIGAEAGRSAYAEITECYSFGRILARRSGGIVGEVPAEEEGRVHIINCYTHGQIGGKYAGGVVGGCGGGDVYRFSPQGQLLIKNTYTAGVLSHVDAGGIIGSISDDFGGEIQVKYSVYNDVRLVGEDPGNNIGSTRGISNNLNEIRGQLYHYNGTQRWSNSTWAIRGTRRLPVLRFQTHFPVSNQSATAVFGSPTPSSHPSPPRRTATRTPGSTTATASPSLSPSPSQRSPTPSPASTSATPTQTPTPFPIYLRDSIIEGKEPCFRFDPEKKMFRMTCSVLSWREQRYGAGTHIFLRAHEVFDGGGGNQHSGNIIDLAGVEDFGGLFKISQNVYSIREGPLIRNLDVRNGTTAFGAGFIVRQPQFAHARSQSYFTIDACSSTGNIKERGGGLAGQECGREGEIKILNSYSQGRTMGKEAGGIIGAEAARYDGILLMTRCYSTGNIEGEAAGGLVGFKTGERGLVYITESHSAGDILESAWGGGGIFGRSIGGRGGIVSVGTRQWWNYWRRRSR